MRFRIYSFKNFALGLVVFIFNFDVLTLYIYMNTIVHLLIHNCKKNVHEIKIKKELLKIAPDYFNCRWILVFYVSLDIHFKEQALHYVQHS